MVRIGLGDMARDKITGFEGIVVAETNYLNNCRRLSIQPQKLQENGKTVDWESFDENQVELVVTAGEPAKEVRHGGPMPSPERW